MSFLASWWLFAAIQLFSGVQNVQQIQMLYLYCYYLLTVLRRLRRMYPCLLFVPLGIGTTVQKDLWGWRLRRESAFKCCSTIPHSCDRNSTKSGPGGYSWRSSAGTTRSGWTWWKRGKPRTWAMATCTQTTTLTLTSRMLIFWIDPISSTGQVSCGFGPGCCVCPGWKVLFLFFFFFFGI